MQWRNVLSLEIWADNEALDIDEFYF